MIRSFMLGFLLAVACCARAPVYAEPERCMESDCSDQRAGYDAGVHARDASFRGDADYVRSM